MGHRVTKLEFVVKPGVLVVRAMGRTGRGTKFHIRSVTIPTESKSKAEVATARAAAIEHLIDQPAAVGL